MRSAHEEDGRLIDGFLTGDAASIRVVDGWIEVALRESASSLSGEWDDLRQEIRARVFRNLDRGLFDGRSALRTYVHRIAKNVCIDLGRKAQRHSMVDAANRLDALRIEESPLERSITRDLLWKMLRGLSEEDRLLLELVFVEQCSYREVADRLSIPEGTVKSRMSRCKDRLLERRSKLLERRGPER